MTFIALKDILHECRPNDLNASGPDFIRLLLRSHLLPVFRLGNDEVVLESDLSRLMPAIMDAKRSRKEWFIGSELFPKNPLPQVSPSADTTVLLPSPGSWVDNTYYSAIHGLISRAREKKEESKTSAIDFQYFPPSRIRTDSGSIESYARMQMQRSDNISSIETSQFANTAYYMGSKRAILGFIVEAMSQVLPDGGIAIDLMCGSGAASSGFSRYWRTIAGDVQAFCTYLATVQGGGFTRERAKRVIEHIIPIAHNHVLDLMKIVGKYVNKEDMLFHSDINSKLVSEYKKYHSDVPTYPTANASGPWKPADEVRQRRQAGGGYPYCLFTAYFANMFLGVRQCVEVDSIRYAIDHLECEEDKRWALGALVATVSALATTYAGHFAQPPFASLDKLTVERVGTLLEKRAYPITQEFCVRLAALAEESERSQFPVEPVSGSWATCLEKCSALVKGDKAAVYVDAPYTREEYSRYYHVLETLIKYNYPSCIGKGKIPDKRADERAKSEFFTRSQQRMEAALVEVISQVLACGWNCVWSYADTGDARIAGVIEEVMRRCFCQARSYVAPHRHQSQGGRRPKEVLEYVVLFTNK